MTLLLSVLYVSSYCHAEINSGGKDLEAEAAGRSGRMVPNSGCRDYYRRKENLDCGGGIGDWRRRFSAGKQLSRIQRCLDEGFS